MILSMCFCLFFLSKDALDTSLPVLEYTALFQFGDKKGSHLTVPLIILPNIQGF